MTGNKTNKTAKTQAAKSTTDREDRNEFDPVALAEKNFNRVLKALDALADELQGRDDAAVAKAAKLAGEARGAIQTIFNERQRIAKLEDDPARSNGADLDLDAARLEIGRRLALLRERGRAEEISGGAE